MLIKYSRFYLPDLDSFTILEREADWRQRGYKRSYLREAGGSRVKQEWWIALLGGLPSGSNLRASRPEDGLGLGRN